jgi:hypothetical protein
MGGNKCGGIENDFKIVSLLSEKTMAGSFDRSSSRFS